MPLLLQSPWRIRKSLFRNTWQKFFRLGKSRNGLAFLLRTVCVIAVDLEVKAVLELLRPTLEPVAHQRGGAPAAVRRARGRRRGLRPRQGGRRRRRGRAPRARHGQAGRQLRLRDPQARAGLRQHGARRAAQLRHGALAGARAPHHRALRGAGYRQGARARQARLDVGEHPRRGGAREGGHRGWRRARVCVRTEYEYLLARVLGASAPRLTLHCRAAAGTAAPPPPPRPPAPARARGGGRTRRRFSYQGANRKWHGILNKRRVASGHQLNSNVDTNSCLRGVLGQIAAKRVMIIESRNEFLTECS